MSPKLPRCRCGRRKTLGKGSVLRCQPCSTEAARRSKNKRRRSGITSCRRPPRSDLDEPLWDCPEHGFVRGAINLSGTWYCPEDECGLKAGLVHGIKAAGLQGNRWNEGTREKGRAT